MSTTLGSKHRVEREIKGSGLSRVFVALDLVAGRDVVAKAIAQDVSAGLNLGRLHREIQLLTQLRHPRVVPVLRVGLSRHTLYFTMPLVSGASLHELLDRQPRLGTDIAVGFALDVAEALSYLHGREVIHGNITPNNILIDHGRAALSDVGVTLAVARSAERDSVLSESGALGHPAYMSPEQLAGDGAIDSRSDIYSLGCVLYEMLAGQPPPKETSHRLLEGHAGGYRHALQIGRPDVPDRVSQAIARALARSPNDRFQSSSEFAAALTTSPEMVSRTARVRPRRAGRLLFVGGVVLVVFGVLGTLWFAR
jgi:serine/threonine-protein kinase